MLSTDRNASKYDIDLEKRHAPDIMMHHPCLHPVMCQTIIQHEQRRKKSKTTSMVPASISQPRRQAGLQE